MLQGDPVWIYRQVTVMRWASIKGALLHRLFLLLLCPHWCVISGPKGAWSDRYGCPLLLHVWTLRFFCAHGILCGCRPTLGVLLYVQWWCCLVSVRNQEPLSSANWGRCCFVSKCFVSTEVCLHTVLPARCLFPSDTCSGVISTFMILVFLSVFLV